MSLTKQLFTFACMMAHVAWASSPQEPTMKAAQGVAQQVAVAAAPVASTVVHASTHQLFSIAQCYWSTGVLGAILMALGATMAFGGKRFFRFFLGASGFLAASTMEFNFLAVADQKIITIPYKLYVIPGASVIMGVLGAYGCIKMWEYGVLACAGFGGYSLGLWLMSLQAGALIQNYVAFEAFIALCTVSAVVMAWFFDNISVIVTSAVGGSVALVVGADCYLKWGLLQMVLAQVMPLDFVRPPMCYHVYLELAAVVAIAVIGGVVQCLAGSGRGGFAKSDRV